MSTLTLLVATLSAGCAASRGVGDSSTSLADFGPVFATGIASFYSDSLAGRSTANGEKYDPDAATCAHKTLPFGTVVLVERVQNGKRAVCRINDRGPFAKGRIIDLSRSVAESLDVDGIAKVRLRKRSS